MIEDRMGLFLFILHVVVEIAVVMSKLTVPPAHLSQAKQQLFSSAPTIFEKVSSKCGLYKPNSKVYGAEIVRINLKASVAEFHFIRRPNIRIWNLFIVLK